jgi:hypothetical protein
LRAVMLFTPVVVLSRCLNYIVHVVTVKRLVAPISELPEFA